MTVHTSFIDEQEHRRSKRRKILIGSGIGLGVLLLIGAAIAALLLRGTVVGAGSIEAPTGVAFTGVSTSKTGAGTCTATLQNPSTIKVDYLQAQPGSSCTLQAGMQRTGAAPATPLKVSKFVYSAVTDDSVVGASCGVDVPAAPAEALVTFRVTVPASPTIGAFTAASDAGVYAADDFTGTCPTS